MRFTKIEKPPHFTYTFSERQKELLEFMNMDVKCVKITLVPGEYKSTNSAQTTLTNCAKKADLPIKVRTRKGEIYLIRTDM